MQIVKQVEQFRDSIRETQIVIASSQATWSGKVLATPQVVRGVDCLIPYGLAGISRLSQGMSW